MYYDGPFDITVGKTLPPVGAEKREHSLESNFEGFMMSCSLRFYPEQIGRSIDSAKQIKHVECGHLLLVIASGAK